MFHKIVKQSKLLCFIYDLSNIQKCNFKEYPFTWVVPLTIFYPSGHSNHYCECWHQPQYIKELINPFFEYF